MSHTKPRKPMPRSVIRPSQVPRVYKGDDVPCGAIMQEMYRRDSGDVNKHAQRA